MRTSDKGVLCFLHLEFETAEPIAGLV